MRARRYLPVALIFTSACAVSGGSSDDAAQTSQAEVSMGNTTTTYSLGDINASSFPALQMATGTFPVTTVNGVTSGPGSYSNYVDLQNPPTTNESAWQNTTANAAALSPYGSDFTAPTYFSDMGSMLTKATADTYGTTVGNSPLLNQLIQAAVSSYFGGHVTYTLPSAADFYGWQPERGQWMRHLLHEEFVPPYQYSNNTYADPPQLQELRERGARLYCAALNANLNQGSTTTMGSQAMATINILGNNVDLLAVQPTVSLGAPNAQKGSANDGAQAFEIPMQFGTIIYPIRGLGLPGLPELRYPVAIETGDTEAITQANYVSNYAWNYQTDVTATNAESIQSAEVDVTGQDTVVLLSLYVLNLELSGEMQFRLGEASTENNRLLVGNEIAGLPETPRTGTIDSALGVTYNDGPWYGCLGGTGPECTTVLPTSAASNRWPLPEPPTGPTFIRAWQDDDHNFIGSTLATLNLSVILDGSLNIPPFDVAVDVTGSISGTASVDHIVQDAMIDVEDPKVAGGQPTPVSALTVRPHTKASINWGDPSTTNPVSAINLTASFSIDLPWPIGTISWQQTLLNVPGMAIASYDSDNDSSSPSGRAWPESGNLRIGTWSPVGTNVTTQPTVDTQLPSASSTFASFPGDVVASCLNGTTQGKAAPPACSAQPAQGAAPKTNLCAYASAMENSTMALPNACSNISTWAQLIAKGDAPYNFLSPTDPNLITLLEELCKGPSYQDGDGRVSHLLSGASTDPTSDVVAFGKDWAAVLSDMATTANNAIYAPVIQLFAAQTILFGACDNNAHLLSASQVASTSTGTNVPPVSTGSTCH